MEVEVEVDEEDEEKEEEDEGAPSQAAFNARSRMSSGTSPNRSGPSSMVECGPPEAIAEVMGCRGGTMTKPAVGVTEAATDDDDAVAACSPLSQPLPPASVPWSSSIIAADAGEAGAADADGSTRGIAWSYAKARKSSSQSNSIGVKVGLAGSPARATKADTRSCAAALPLRWGEIRDEPI